MQITGNFDTTTNEGWLNELAFQLRLRGATGQEVGDALAEAQAHLADSGEAASEAFGTPDAYAEMLMPKSRREGLNTWAGAMLAGGCGYVGITMLLGAALSGGERVPFTVGTVVGVGVLAVVSLILTMASGYLFRHAGLLAALLVVGAIGIVAPGIGLRAPLAQPPVASAVIVGVVMLAGAVQQLFRIMKGDPVVDPRKPAGVLNDEERRLVREGHQLEAMKAHRARTGATLRQAARAVEDARG